MITIIDYGMGNIESIKNMIQKAGGDANISKDPDTIKLSSAIILPGVGSFDNAMQKLQDHNLIEPIKEFINDNKPLLGICLGMQLMFDDSEEGKLPGLGIVKGRGKRFLFKSENSHLKIPHMGWNQVLPRVGEELFDGLERDARFYFVHSYHVVCEDPENVIAECDYGYKFCCAIHKGNIYGVQFHPEKSHSFGMLFFKNFLRIVCSASV